MGGCPGTMLGSRSCPANPHDRDRDSKPQDSRDRDKNLRDSPAAKIPQGNESRHLGTRIPVCLAVSLQKNSKILSHCFLCPVGPWPGQKSAGRAGPGKIFAGQAGPGQNIAGMSHPFPVLKSCLLLEFVVLKWLYDYNERVIYYWKPRRELASWWFIVSSFQRKMTPGN